MMMTVMMVVIFYPVWSAESVYNQQDIMELKNKCWFIYWKVFLKSFK